MKALLRNLFVLLIVLAPVSAFSFEYPKTYKGDLPQYPSKLAGFKKGQIMVYAPDFDLSNYSVSYTYTEKKKAVIIDTFYLFDKELYEKAIGSSDPREILEQTISATVEALPGSRKLSIEEADASINGKTYHSYRGSFIEKRQDGGEYYAEIWMVPLETKYIKLRMSSSRSDITVQQKTGDLLRELIAIADAK